jgi:hypothetical protein
VDVWVAYFFFPSLLSLPTIPFYDYYGKRFLFPAFLGSPFLLWDSVSFSSALHIAHQTSPPGHHQHDYFQTTIYFPIHITKKSYDSAICWTGILGYNILRSSLPSLHNISISPTNRPPTPTMIFPTTFSLILALAPTTLFAAPTQVSDSIAALIPRQDLPKAVVDQLIRTNGLCDLSKLTLPVGMSLLSDPLMI